VVGYSGNMGRVHDFRAILGAAQRLAKYPDIVFLFIGDSFYREWIEREAQRLGLRNIVFRPYQPRTRLLDSLGVPDVHLISLRPDMEGLVFPSKLYGVLAAGRATVFVGAEDGDVAQILRGGKCGLAVSEDDTQGVAEAILALEQDPARCQAMGAQGRRLFERHYAMHIALKRWCHVLSPLLADEEDPCEEAGPEKGWHDRRRKEA
jgi:colanic acid biosynthesis glycosyl transferase WcaI